MFAFMHRSRVCYLDFYVHLFTVKDLRARLFYSYTYITANVFFLPFMYYLAIKVAHEIGVIMKKLALCYHNTFVERLLQQHEQDE